LVSVPALLMGEMVILVPTGSAPAGTLTLALTPRALLLKVVPDAPIVVVRLPGGRVGSVVVVVGAVVVVTPVVLLVLGVVVLVLGVVAVVVGEAGGAPPPPPPPGGAPPPPPAVVVVVLGVVVVVVVLGVVVVVVELEVVVGAGVVVVVVVPPVTSRLTRSVVDSGGLDESVAVMVTVKSPDALGVP